VRWLTLRSDCDLWAAAPSTGFYFFAKTNIFAIGSNYSVKVNPPKPYKSSTPAAQTFSWEGAEVNLGSFVLQ
jgi:hypothetical protein